MSDAVFPAGRDFPVTNVSGPGLRSIPEIFPAKRGLGASSATNVATIDHTPEENDVQLTPEAIRAAPVRFAAGNKKTTSAYQSELDTAV